MFCFTVAFGINIIIVYVVGHLHLIASSSPDKMSRNKERKRSSIKFHVAFPSEVDIKTGGSMSNPNSTKKGRKRMKFVWSGLRRETFVKIMLPTLEPTLENTLMERP